MAKYFVIVPVFNEAKRLRKCLNRILEYHKDIIVVNDGSTDNTMEILKDFSQINIINLPKNSGKGLAMKRGATLAWKLGAQGIIFMDGDNQHDPKHIAEFTSQLRKRADIVIGVRVLRTKIPYYRKLGNFVMAVIMRGLFSVRMTDMMCGYRAFSKKGYKDVLWRSNGYEVETEVVAKIGDKNLPYRTVVVDTIYHDKYKGFSVFDGLRILAKIPSWKMNKI